MIFLYFFICFLRDLTSLKARFAQDSSAAQMEVEDLRKANLELLRRVETAENLAILQQVDFVTLQIIMRIFSCCFILVWLWLLLIFCVTFLFVFAKIVTCIEVSITPLNYKSLRHTYSHIHEQTLYNFPHWWFLVRHPLSLSLCLSLCVSVALCVYVALCISLSLSLIILILLYSSF